MTARASSPPAPPSGCPPTAQGIRVAGDPDGPGPYGRRQRRLRRQPLRRRPRGRRRRLPHRGPAPPPGVRGRAQHEPARAARRGALGHRVALVRAGRRPARRDLRPARMGPAGPRLRARSPTPGPPTRRPPPPLITRSPQLNAEPADQIRLLDVQALDVRLSAARPQAQVAARARRDRVADQGPHAAARPARRRADRGERHRPRADQGRAGRRPGAPARRPRPAAPRLRRGHLARRTWRTSSARSSPSPSARATWRTSSWRSWSAASPRRSGSPS